MINVIATYSSYSFCAFNSSSACSCGTFPTSCGMNVSTVFRGKGALLRILPYYFELDHESARKSALVTSLFIMYKTKSKP